ncbi:MAG: penicillin-binding protein activator [Alphaproteobacteria bacterium]|nr:penicillin-binding protein activator [Alphaproteobacteria bacterium]MCW5740942.1 penicillin-binding protein activator [Alphaproteobacteria bacterium]
MSHSVGTAPRRRVATMLACAAMAMIALAGCETKPNPAASSRPIAPPPGPVPPSPMSPAVTPSGKPKIALLLPLSGRAREIGHALQDAAELALFDGAGRDIALVPIDTGDTPNGAVAATERAIREGSNLILGPLFSVSAAVAGPVARQANLEMISFSNDEGTAQPGLYVMGLAVEPQVRRVVDYAQRRGVRRIVALAPASGYGGQAMQALRDAAQRANINVGASETVPASGDPAAPVKRVVATIGADGSGTALFIPIGAPRVNAVASSLAEADIASRRVRLLGTGVWDVANIGGEKALVGAWFAGPDPARRAAFERKFESVHGRAPPRIATLAYDAVMLAARLARLRAGGDFTAGAITDGGGFNGLDGRYRFRTDGRVERSLAILEIEDDRLKVVDPAPSAFMSVVN